MLELVPRPQFTVVVPPRLLQEGYLVHFPGDWPSTLTSIRNKTFRIEATNQVPFALSGGFIIPTGDFRDVDLSNGSGQFQESIYPIQDKTLFEVSLGLKPGNYVVHFFIPATRSIHNLEFAGQVTDVTSPTLVYLGARRPEDSPADNPTIKFYLVNGLAALVLRCFVLPGVDFEKVVLQTTINKCLLQEVPEPTQDDMRKAKVIKYFESLRW